MIIPGSASDAAPPPLTGGCVQLRLAPDRDGPGLTIWINRPETAPPPQGWPTLILLEGEACFTAAAEMAQRLARRSAKTRVEPMLVIGLALGHDIHRQSSFSFASDAERPHGETGGQSLLRGLSSRLLAAIEAECGDTTRLTLLGHSMSGQFVLEARALTAPFARYVAVSPSIWSNPSVVAAQPERAPADADDLFVVVGGQEEMPGLDPAHLARRMVSHARELLKKGGVRLHVLDNEDHGSAPYASLPAALRFASEP